MLSGTQWQLLCVIIRQTQGWHDPHTGGRKQSDWLSHGQLRRRTGRGSDALCHAIDALVRRELIEVCDEQGHLLSTPVERQRARRLFFSLSPQLLRHFLPAQSGEKKPVRQAKPAASAPSSIRHSRFGKAETTKETLTKKRQKKPCGKTEWSPTGESPLAFSRGRQTEVGCGCFSALSSPTLPASTPFSSTSSFFPSAAAGTPDQEELHQEGLLFLETFQSQHSKYFGGGAKETATTLTATPLTARQSAQLHAALARYGCPHLEQMLEVFFRADTSYIRRHGHTLSVFLEMLHVLPFLRPHHTAQ